MATPSISMVNRCARLKSPCVLVLPFRLSRFHFTAMMLPPGIRPPQGTLCTAVRTECPGFRYDTCQPPVPATLGEPGTSEGPGHPGLPFSSLREMGTRRRPSAGHHVPVPLFRLARHLADAEDD